MRLIRRLDSGHLELTKNFDEEELLAISYAVLSHTWSENNDDEITYRDFLSKTLESLQQEKPLGHAKLQFCSERIAEDRLEYFWIDTCCINRGSSEELQESITSMFSYYRNATKCYVYLTDVSTIREINSKVSNRLSIHLWEPAFRKSRWFTRGWTLQELLAPRCVEFYSRDGFRIGDKSSLENCIYEITGISYRALRGVDLTSFSYEERLKWFTGRETRRTEDNAYCRLGIFNVSMIHNYGEGADHAMDRLREQIKRRQAEGDRRDRKLEVLPLVAEATLDLRDPTHQPRCLPHTRQELLARLDEWVTGNDDRHLCWLNGIAGTGKSTIARTVASIHNDDGRLGACFFFSGRSGHLSNAKRFVTTIARQLAIAVPRTKRHICEAVAANANILEQPLREQWSRLILNPLSELVKEKVRPFTILMVIDALDECDDERDVRDILRVLGTSRPLANVHLRILLSSRSEISMPKDATWLAESKCHIFTLHEEPSDQVNRDIQLFFQSRFHVIREKRGLPRDWPDARTVQALVESSCGLFIWASTACRFIEEETHRPEDRISILVDRDASLVDLRPSLDKIYDTVLQNFIPKHGNDVHSLKNALGYIVVLRTALSIEALAALLGRQSEELRTTLAGLQPIIRLSDHPSTPICLHHPTFREFLLEKSRCSVPHLWIDENETHGALADSCVEHMSQMLPRYLESFELAQSLLNGNKSRHRVPQVSPSLRYACLYWIEHYRQSRTQLHDGDLAHCFFENFSNEWVQVMVLMQKGSEIGALVRMYHSLLLPSLNVRQLPFVKSTRQQIVALQPSIKWVSTQHHLTLPLFRPPGQVTDERPLASSWTASHANIGSQNPMPSFNNFVNEVVFTSDGLHVASGSSREAARLWDIGIIDRLHVLEDDFTEKVSSVGIHPNGVLLAAGSDDTTIRVWNLSTMKIQHTLEPRAGWVNALSFSPDGNVLASGSMDGTIVFWNIHTGSEIRRFDNQNRCVNSMQFSPDGLKIVTGSDDEMIRLWTVGDLSGVPDQILDGEGQGINCVKFSPDGKRILFGSDDSLMKLWDISTGECLTFRGHSMKVTTVAFSPDSHTVVSGSEDTTIRIWDASNGDPIRTLRDHTKGVNAFAFSQTGSLFASSSFDDEMRLWDTRTWKSRVLPSKAEARMDSPVSAELGRLQI